MFPSPPGSSSANASARASTKRDERGPSNSARQRCRGATNSSATNAAKSRLTSACRRRKNPCHITPKNRRGSTGRNKSCSATQSVTRPTRAPPAASVHEKGNAAQAPIWARPNPKPPQPPTLTTRSSSRLPQVLKRRTNLDGSFVRRSTQRWRTSTNASTSSWTRATHLCITRRTSAGVTSDDATSTSSFTSRFPSSTSAGVHNLWLSVSGSTLLKTSVTFSRSLVSKSDTSPPMRRAALGTTPCQPINPKPRRLIGKNIIVTASLFVSALKRPAHIGMVA